ncbi:MAG: ABC transporter permease [Candidatus Limimorpha sp.]
MFDFDYIKEIWQSIARNKTRSVMTAFGVFWGVFILVVLLSLGKGFENGMLHEIEGFSTNSAFLIPMPTTEAYKGYQKGRQWSVYISDIEMIKNSVNGIEHVCPIVGGPNTNDNNVFFGIKGGKYNMKGVLPVYNEIDRCKVVYGRFLNDLDVAQERKVCVIGMKVYEDIIGMDKDPIGVMLKVNGIYCQVVGVVSPYSGNISIMGRNNESVFMPITTMQKAYSIGNGIDLLAFTAAEGNDIKVLESEVKHLLRARHDISPADEGSLMVIDFVEMFNIFKYLFLGINILIWIIGVGTLLSGVVGVSNIMLVTIKERTREIGVRRAIGAKPSMIIRQVVYESLMLTVLAGVTGLVAGVSLMAGIGAVTSNHPNGVMMFINPYISFNTAVAATLVIILSGLLSGLLPAMRAVQIKAIDAIREE